MTVFSISKAVGGAFLLLSTLASAVVSHHVHINDNYMLDFELSKDNKSIEFRIQSINVKGWVGIGINDNRKDMIGADLFIGGFNSNTGRSYGWDYHVPSNAANGAPIRDEHNDWNFTITEVNGTTNVIASRLLKTSDTQNDTEITNKFTNLLWAYQLTSDDILVHHDKQGPYSVNLITGEPNPNQGSDSGAEIISVCVGTLLMGLVAAVLKY